MEIIRSIREMQRRATAWNREGTCVGLVPTMGYLHEAHLSLIRLARKHSDVVVVSLFVNPTQFGPTEDLTRYPRDEARDRVLCERQGADILFIPPAEEMYGPEPRVFVDEIRVATRLEGQSRPGHFRGVLTVVAKLFNLVQPDVAVFGEKDAQQLHLIRCLVRDMDFPVRIVPGPLVREPDGLAMSSRNVYLSAEERRDATALNRALAQAKKNYESGEREAAALKANVAATLGSAKHVRLDYVEVVDDRTFEPVARLEGPCRVVLAAHVGRTRLIDNVRLGASDDHG